MRADLVQPGPNSVLISGTRCRSSVGLLEMCGDAPSVFSPPTTRSAFARSLGPRAVAVIASGDHLSGLDGCSQSLIQPGADAVREATVAKCRHRPAVELFFHKGHWCDGEDVEHRVADL